MDGRGGIENKNAPRCRIKKEKNEVIETQYKKKQLYTIILKCPSYSVVCGNLSTFHYCGLMRCEKQRQ